jgi:tetratricopeptide (TPR) repeat protein
MPAGAAVILAAAHLYWVSLPTSRAAAALERLETALHTPPPEGGPQAVLAAAERAVRASDPSAARLAARTVVQISRLPKLDEAARRNWLGLARSYAQAAVRHNPRDTTNHALLAVAEQELANALGSAASPDQAWPAWARHAWVWERHAWERHAWERAAASWDDAVERYPTNPRARISAGRAWLVLWQLGGRSEAADRAREHFEQALWIDDQRPPQDTVRLRPRERDQVAGYLRQLMAPVPSSGPTR